MNSENDSYEVIFCPEDDEYRIYCDICDKLRRGRYFKNHLISGTHTNNSYKKISKQSCDIKMHWRCDICDEVMYEEFRKIQLQSGFHKRLASSIIRNYIITKPQSNKIDDTIKKSLRSHY